MFRECIAATALTGPIPDSALPNIQGRDFRGDISFTASARAFLTSRMTEDDWVTITYRNCTDPAPISTEYFLRADRPITGEDTLYVVSLAGSKEASAKALEDIDKEFINKHGGFVEVPKIKAFYARSFAARCFVCRETRTSVVFADHIDLRTLHFLECSILVMLPWYLEVEPVLSDKETALVKCLMDKGSTAADYLKCIEAIAEQFDFRTKAIRAQLTGFENKYRQAQLRRVQDEVSNCNDMINTLLMQIADYSNRREDAMVRALGLRTAIDQADGGGELVDFFLAHKNIELVSVNDRSFRVAIKTQYEPVDSIADADQMRNLINNKSSWVYRGDSGKYAESNAHITEEDMGSLMTALFVDGVLKLNLCAAFNIGLNPGDRVPITGYPFGHDYDDYMPNPHIQRYACMGSYVGVIADLLSRGDYIQIAATCIAVTGSLNFGDTVVMSELMSILWGVRRGQRKAIVLPDGKVCTPEEAIAWLKEQKGE